MSTSCSSRGARIALLTAGLLLGPLALVAATPAPAEAQLGWVKKALGMKKKKPAQPPAAAQTPGAPNAGAPAGQAGAPPGGAAGAPATSATATGAAGTAATQTPDPAAVQKQAEKDTMLAYGRRLDSQQPQTMATAKERLDYWESLKLGGMMETEVFQRYQQALRDYDQFRQQDSVQKARDASANAVNAKIERATRMLQARDLDGAQTAIDEVLVANPDNQRAVFIKDQILTLQRARRFKIVLVALGAALVALAVGAGVIARKVLKKEKGENGKAAAAATAGPTQKALIKVVDGVGRGKLFTVDGDVFRIGAAQSDRPEEHNDIILSDSASAVSRFHCSIIRKGKDYFLVDSSLNGTEVNDKRLERGEHHRLGDGDEFTIAAVSRLKFLRT